MIRKSSRPARRRPFPGGPAATLATLALVAVSVVGAAARQQRAGRGPNTPVLFAGMTLEIRAGRLIVTAVEPGSAAAQAGLRPLDAVLVVDDLSLVDLDPIPPAKVLEIFRRGPADPGAINQKRSSEFRIVVGRGGGTLTIHLKPTPDDDRRAATVGPDAGPLRPGSEAPPFAVRDLKGELISLQAFRGRPVLIDFWASWCAPCRQSSVTLRRLAEEHAGRLVIVGVSLDDDRRACEAFAYNLHLPGHQICGGGRSGPVGRLYGIGSSGIPFAVLVDPEGRVAAAGGSLQEMEEVIARLAGASGSRPGG